MSDTKVLLNKIAAFRERLDQMPRLSTGLPPELTRPLAPTLPSYAGPTSPTQAVLAQGVRAVVELPEATTLSPAAKRLAEETRTFMAGLRTLADDPLLAGPTDDAIDPLALHYRETAAMMEPLVRGTQTLPEEPVLQERLTEGLRVMLDAAKLRHGALLRALEVRRNDAETVEALARVFAFADERFDTAAIDALVTRLRAEPLAGPLRFPSATPEATRSTLGGTEFPAPLRFLAAKGVATARVLLRMLRGGPEASDACRLGLVSGFGLTRVPAELLAQADAFSDVDRSALAGHRTYAARRLRSVGPEWTVIAEALEQRDGEPVSMLAKLLAVAETYAAFVTPRPHRPALDPRTALTDTLVLAERGRLDRFAAEKLLNLAFYPVGSVTELADGSIGVVVANRIGGHELQRVARPVVHLLTDPQGAILPMPYPLDLAEEGGSILRTLGSEERARLFGRHYPEWAV